MKKRLFTLITAVALLVAVAGASGIVADALGLSITPQVLACDPEGGSGGC